MTPPSMPDLVLIEVSAARQQAFATRTPNNRPTWIRNSGFGNKKSWPPSQQGAIRPHRISRPQRPNPRLSSHLSGTHHPRALLQLGQQLNALKLAGNRWRRNNPRCCHARRRGPTFSGLDTKMPTRRVWRTRRRRPVLSGLSLPCMVPQWQES